MNVYLVPYTRLNTLGKDLVPEKHGLSYHQKQTRGKNGQTVGVFTFVSWKGLLEDARVDRPHLDRTACPRGQV